MSIDITGTRQGFGKAKYSFGEVSNIDTYILSFNIILTNPHQAISDLGYLNHVHTW
jgi:hypothetical protein